MLPDPVITEHDGFLVVRDDLLPGGTKRRAIDVFFDDHSEYVYPSPVYGYAQLALAYACQDHHKQAVVFCAKRADWYPLTREAERAGARMHEVPHGYLNVVKARAREYCDRSPWAKLLPFGLDDPLFVERLASIARALPVAPREVWSIAGSGCLTRALQMAWPEAIFYVVRVGAEPKAGKAIVFNAPEPYEKDALMKPPFPSSGHYDAKMWQFIKRYALPGALIWNVS